MPDMAWIAVWMVAAGVSGLTWLERSQFVGLRSRVLVVCGVALLFACVGVSIDHGDVIGPRPIGRLIGRWVKGGVNADTGSLTGGTVTFLAAFAGWGVGRLVFRSRVTDSSYEGDQQD